MGHTEGMGVRRVLHTAVSTPDLDRAVAFWTRLGFTEVRRWEWPAGTAPVDALLGVEGSAARAALLEGHGTGVELFEFASPAQPDGPPGAPAVHRHGYTHLAFEVDDLDEELARLAVVGLGTWSAPVTDPSGRRLVYARDPDGNVIELVQPAPGVRARTSAAP